MKLFGKKHASAGDADKRERIETMYQGARKVFPDVPEISAAEVLARTSAGADIVLVDARSPEEQAVSMIPGAITAMQLEATPDAAAGRTVVCYCTIGGRSGRYASELRARGVDALNMPGAVLAWTHEGGPLVDADGQPTTRVHTHGPKFALVAEGYEAVFAGA